MCWVIPPASPAATSVSRIASSSEVLPWSTWPMIVIDRRAVLEVGGVVVDLLATSTSSSAAVTISILRSNFFAIAST